MDIMKRLVDQALWKYTSVLLAQPFEVAKTVLQVQVASTGQDGSLHRATAEDMRRQPGSYRYDTYDVCPLTYSTKPLPSKLTPISRYPQTIQILIFPHTSPPQLLYPIHPLVLLDLAAVIVDLDRAHPTRFVRLLRTSFGPKTPPHS